MRINKYLAQALGVSRREADEYLISGRVTINGSPASIGNQITDSDSVSVDGKQISKADSVYVALHKPVGYVCSRKRQGDTPTIYELLPEKYHVLKTVGRLDKNSSGLILLTNDGDFAQRMTHPKYEKEKQYEVILDKLLTANDLKNINSGICLEDGLSKLLVEEAGGEYLITMREGRNRQIRRTFETLGFKVEKLHRTKFGDYSLENLPPGKTQEIDTA